MLSGFPDRVGHRRSGNQVLLSTGVSAELTGSAPGYEFLVAIDAEDRKENPLPLVRLTARVEPEWLLDLFPARVRDSSTVAWSTVAERVEQVSALRYDKLIIDESRGKASDEEAAALLAQKALDAGIDQFVDKALLNDYLERLAFAGFEAPNMPQAMRAFCLGLHSFSELRGAAQGFLNHLGQRVDSKLLEVLAPSSISLPAHAGRRFTTIPVNRHGSLHGCRTSSACARAPGSALHRH